MAVLELPSTINSQSMLHLRFTGIQWGEPFKRVHSLSIALPAVLSEASDEVLASFALCTLSGTLDYTEVNDIEVVVELLASDE